MKTKKQYNKHNKLTKSKRVNKANKKIGGAELKPDWENI